MDLDSVSRDASGALPLRYHVKFTEPAEGQHWILS